MKTRHERNLVKNDAVTVFRNALFDGGRFLI